LLAQAKTAKGGDAVEPETRAWKGAGLATPSSVTPHRVVEAERVLSRYPLKGVLCPKELLSRLAMTAHSRMVCVGYHGSVSARRQRFLRDERAAQSDAAVLKKLASNAGNATVVLACGNGYAGSNPRRGERFGRSPVKRLVRYLSRYMCIVLVDEFRTSANCCVCSRGKMTYEPDRKGTCDSCPRSERRDRDENAAVLMLTIAHSLMMSGRRPEALRRASDDDEDGDIPEDAARV
jgi:hypothetical protein